MACAFPNITMHSISWRQEEAIRAKREELLCRRHFSSIYKEKYILTQGRRFILRVGKNVRTFRCVSQRVCISGSSRLSLHFACVFLISLLHREDQYTINYSPGIKKLLSASRESRESHIKWAFSPVVDDSMYLSALFFYYSISSLKCARTWRTNATRILPVCAIFALCGM